jgi:hypothetical protein
MGCLLCSPDCLPKGPGQSRKETCESGEKKDSVLREMTVDPDKPSAVKIKSFAQKGELQAWSRPAEFP